METRLFLKFMHGIEDVHAKGGKFVTNHVDNQQEPENDPQAEKLEKIISKTVPNSHAEWWRHLFWIGFLFRRVNDLLREPKQDHEVLYGGKSDLRRLH